MNILGIIAEYNPFHKGHLYHLNQSKKKTGADVTVAVMSGNFTQRGEPAIWDKWSRSKAAVEKGVDLVLELPFVYACNSAEFFAKGSVGILEGLGCITHLSFGSEEGNIAPLQELADYLVKEPASYKEHLKEGLKEGFSFPKARAMAVERDFGKNYSLLLKEANNILGIEYLKQIQKTDGRIKPVTIKREGSGYHDIHVSGGFPSAAAVRKAIKDGACAEYNDCFPCDEEGRRESPVFLENFYPFFLENILSRNKDSLSRILSVGEGLENSLKAKVRQTESLEDYIEKIATKRYPKTRIKRILFHSLLGLTKEAFSLIEKEGILHSRVLAFNDKGADLLKQLKKSAERCRVKLLTNINKETDKTNSVIRSLHYDILAADIYNLAAGKNLYENCDYVRRPYYKRSTGEK